MPSIENSFLKTKTRSEMVDLLPLKMDLGTIRKEVAICKFVLMMLMESVNHHVTATVNYKKEIMYIVKHKNEDLYFDKSGREFTEDISRATTYKTAMAAEVSLKSSNSKYMFKRYEFEINQFEIREAKIVLV